MNLLLQVMLWVLTSTGLVMIVLHHGSYLRGTRPMNFGASLETAGWVIVTLVTAAALGGGLTAPGTRIVETAAATVGVLCIGIGSRFARRPRAVGK